MGDVIEIPHDWKSRLQRIQQQSRARAVLKDIMHELVTSPEIPEYFEPVDYILVRLFDEGIILAEIDNGDDDEAA